MLLACDAMPRTDAPPYRYNAALAAEIEARWQQCWDDEGVYEAPNPSGSLSDSTAPAAGRTKLFIMDMFPYPSGSGLHVGHPLGYIATDVYARFKRMTGFNVLHTMGFDAFGLPAEEHARQTGQHPRVNTEANIANMKRQLGRLGLGHDKRRAVATTDVAYYRWTQWIFLKMFDSWFDPRVNRARPIGELVMEFANGSRSPSPAEANGRSWAQLDDAERSRIVNGYRLAYVDEAPVNWCPALGTVLANEEVTVHGRSERGNHEVFQRPMRQWMLRITAYADRLLDDLDLLDWPDSVKTMQRNWIGRSSGAVVSFPVVGADDGARSGGGGEAADDESPSEAPVIKVFTTRPDTIFGTTYMVLAPENPLVDELVAGAWPEGTDSAWTAGASTPVEAVAAYRALCDRASSRNRRGDAPNPDDEQDKTGVYLGVDAVVPVNGRSVPVFISDYVLMGYGTGAVMAVPGEDERDWAFAERFGLPIIRTVEPPPDHPVDQAYTGEGKSINSGFLDGLGMTDAKARIVEWMEENGCGEAAVSYKLRDWLFSRQRYWGEPFPIVFDENDLPVGLPDEMLPVELPDLSDWAPRALDPDSAPEPPLSRVPHWAQVELDLDGRGSRRYQRELNTMPQWAGSCWYYLRYLDPDNDDALVDPLVERYWMGGSDGDGAPGAGGVDLYVGGVEHAVLHLLYARFWHKVLYDLGFVSGLEPFKRLVNQGYILAAAYCDDRGVYVPADEVQGSPADGFTYKGRPVHHMSGKMGKSLKNSVTPDDMYASYGADTLRLYEMAMGPIDQDRPWQTRSVVGAQRMLQRVWRNVVDEHTGELRVCSDSPDDALRKLMHRTVAGVRADMQALRFNTAIAKITEFNNAVTGRSGDTPSEVADVLVRLLAPLVPHFAEELWHRLNRQGDLRAGSAGRTECEGVGQSGSSVWSNSGRAGSVAWADFPDFDETLLVEDTVEVPVQVNGRIRGRVTVPADAGETAVVAAALADPNVAAHIGGRELRKKMYVSGRIVTLVT